MLLVSVRQRRLGRSAGERLGALDAAEQTHAREPGESWLDGIDETRRAHEYVRGWAGSRATATADQARGGGIRTAVPLTPMPPSRGIAIKICEGRPISSPCTISIDAGGVRVPVDLR